MFVEPATQPVHSPPEPSHPFQQGSGVCAHRRRPDHQHLHHVLGRAHPAGGYHGHLWVAQTDVGHDAHSEWFEGRAAQPGVASPPAQRRTRGFDVHVQGRA